jgi:hypothetical protein|tara:strand:+ start:711 stop:911 length:201 start_codon:yes stop_codon:yes gene_type:complete
MKKFKSITVNETTYDAVDHLTKTLLPKVKLSKAQVVENLVKGSHEEIIQNKENHEDQRHAEDSQNS